MKIEVSWDMTLHGLANVSDILEAAGFSKQPFPGACVL
jgi:hypothetical protein